MGAPLTPAGWYPDPSGTPGWQRYFDGSDWTDHHAPLRMSGEERSELLDAEIARYIKQFPITRVESRSAYQATLAIGSEMNHLPWLILTIFSCGLFAVIWIIAAASDSGVRRVTLQVDAQGNVTHI